MANGLLLVDGFGVGLRSPVGLIDGVLDETTVIGAEVDGLGVGFGVRGPPDGVMVGFLRKLGDADGEGVGMTVEGPTKDGLVDVTGANNDGVGDADDEGVGMTVEGPAKDGLGDVTGPEGPEVGKAIMVG
jgi:hypothetical protein